MTQLALAIDIESLTVELARELDEIIASPRIFRRRPMSFTDFASPAFVRDCPGLETVRVTGGVL